jgi:hypothetical protein
MGLEVKQKIEEDEVQFGKTPSSNYDQHCSPKPLAATTHERLEKNSSHKTS